MLTSYAQSRQNRFVRNIQPTDAQQMILEIYPEASFHIEGVHTRYDIEHVQYITRVVTTVQLRKMRDDGMFIVTELNRTETETVYTDDPRTPPNQLAHP